jgi:hypothetical protein
MGTMVREEGEKGSGRGGWLIKIADFIEEERGRNFHGSCVSRHHRRPEITRVRTERA